MKSVGIIVEYNPFHNGHMYQIDKIRNMYPDCCIVAVMSGNFVQRGEPAVIDKYTRAQMAVMAGVNLVIELPCIYSLASAETFAKGGVSILSALGVDYICFGSEYGELDYLQKIATILCNEPKEYKEELGNNLKKGLSFPAARQKAVAYVMQEDCDALSKPNNILAIEYLKAIIKNNYNIIPITILRTGSGYNDMSLPDSTNTFASASAIRKELLASNTASCYSDFIPECLRPVYKNVLQYSAPICLDDFSDLIIYKLLSDIQNNTDFSSYFSVSESLSNKLYKNVQYGMSATKLIESLKSKELTYSSISRALCNILLDNYNDSKKDIYVKILGFDTTGQKYLSDYKKNCPVPLITKPALYKNILAKDAYASDIYNHIVYSKYNVLLKSDYTHNIYIKKSGDSI